MNSWVVGYLEDWFWDFLVDHVHVIHMFPFAKELLWLEALGI